MPLVRARPKTPQRKSVPIRDAKHRKDDAVRENIKKLTLRLNETEYARLRQLSEASGLKFEPLLRQLLLGTELRPHPPDCYAALLRELSGIGTNINQLAHWANGKGYATQAEIHEASMLALQAWQLVKDTL